MDLSAVYVISIVDGMPFLKLFIKIVFSQSIPAQTGYKKTPSHNQVGTLYLEID